ncbi:MAG: hypothetical protein PHN99_04905, partial [Eubacteriales bacterium]|nr:hypothetical protein [Eubacteriales bacterium]
LDYSRYPETLENWDDYTSAIFMLINSRNIALNECRFECRAPDDRYALTADRVDGLLIQNSVFQKAKGLLKHIGCNNLSVPLNSDVFEVTGIELENWRKNLEISLDSHNYLSECAVSIDEALTLPDYSEMRVSDNEMSWNADIYVDNSMKKTMVYVPSFYGELDLYAGNIHAGEYKIYSRYQFPTQWACDITKHLKLGQNPIRLICSFSDEGKKFYPGDSKPEISLPPEIRISMNYRNSDNTISQNFPETPSAPGISPGKVP